MRAIRGMRVITDVIWFIGCIHGAALGTISIAANDAYYAFIGGVLCAACFCALAERIVQRAKENK